MVTKLFRRILPLTLAALLLLTLLPGAGFSESDKTEKTVRVGFFPMDNFMEGGADGRPQSGFTYELLCEIASYNHWKIEYVYGDFIELYGKLAAGEINLLPNIIDTEERREQVLFHPFSLNEEHYFISALRANVTEEEFDPASLNGKKLVTVRGALEERCFDEWAAEHGITMEKITCDDYSEGWETVRAGEADCLLSIDNTVPDAAFRTLIEVGANHVYFALGKGREDLVADIDYALEMMNGITPFLISNLQQKYLNDALSSHELSPAEREWVDTHTVLRIGGLRGDVPYAYEGADGKVIGTYVDLTDLILEKLSLDSVSTEWTLYGTVEEMRTALKNGEVDVICPEYHSYYEAGKEGLALTETAMNIPMGLLTPESGNPAGVRVLATCNTRPGIIYVEESFTDVEVLVLDTVDALVRAVGSGQADAAVAHIYALQDSLGEKATEFTISPLSKPCTICYAATEQDHELIMLINRGYHLIAQDEKNMLDYQAATGRTVTETANDFLRKNLGYVIASALLTLAVAAYAIIRTVSSRRLAKDLEESTRENEIIETARRELEIAKDQAQAASKAKTNFLFNMSHDIRTPMNAIIGYTGIARKNTAEPETADYLDKIGMAGNQLLGLVNQVLEMSRIESGKVALQEQRIDLSEAGRTFSAVYGDQAKNRGLDFSVRFTGVEHDRVIGDKDRLYQIVNNLIGNALKYTPDGGSISVTVGELPCDRPGYANCRITVTDTGIGMSPEFLPHLYDEFSREETSTVNGIQGTGLGMPIVKKLVELMDGTIGVESEPGKGSRFTVTVPLRIDTEYKEEEKAAMSGAGQVSLEGMKILLVEDNEMNREIAQEILTDHGAVIDTAEDGAIAVEKVRNAAPGQYDVILMDVQMPRMNGYEAAKAIRALENRALAELPIFAMTANAFEEDRRNALAAGMNGHLAKPVDVPKLMETLAGIRE